MDDIIDEIVNNAMEHKMVLQVGIDLAQPAPTVVVAGIVFGQCVKGCTVSMGVIHPGDELEPTFNVYEAECRHRLYVATADAFTRKRPTPSHRTIMPAFRAGDPCPTCGAAMVQKQGGVECLSDHK